MRLRGTGGGGGGGTLHCTRRVCWRCLQTTTTFPSPLSFPTTPTLQPLHLQITLHFLISLQTALQFLLSVLKIPHHHTPHTPPLKSLRFLLSPLPTLPTTHQHPPPPPWSSLRCVSIYLELVSYYSTDCRDTPLSLFLNCGFPVTFTLLKYLQHTG